MGKHIGGRVIWSSPPISQNNLMHHLQCIPFFSPQIYFQRVGQFMDKFRNSILEFSHIGMLLRNNIYVHTLMHRMLERSRERLSARIYIYTAFIALILTLTLASEIEANHRMLMDLYYIGESSGSNSAVKSVKKARVKSALINARRGAAASIYTYIYPTAICSAFFSFGLLLFSPSRSRPGNQAIDWSRPAQKSHFLRDLIFKGVERERERERERCTIRAANHLPRQPASVRSCRLSPFFYFV